MSLEFKIGSAIVGINHPPYFIADIGANHDGNLERAFLLIELAKEAGAHAAKFQNFSAAKIVSKYGFENLKANATHQTGWKKSVFEIYKDASIDKNWTAPLRQKCDEVGIEYFTSAYDFESVDNVDPYVNVYKIGSGDITWLEVLEYTAKKGKPIILATGAASMEDVERAMNKLSAITSEIALLQCNTNYATDKDKAKYVNLNVLKTFKDKYPDTLLGLSDHTIGYSTVAGSISLGARIIEKHFTDNNDREGPDHKFAMNPANWRQMVDTANEIFYALGDGKKRIEDNEISSRIVQQRCLRATCDLPAGAILELANVEVLRPCPEDALRPYELDEYVGRILQTPVTKGEHFTRTNFEEND
ncbi:MAG: N-acetylneuraminate synthase [Chitinophagaceae bacterium]|nr:N-acetylneuraminate synthase [Chitinophagaceae bacterium]